LPRDGRVEDGLEVRDERERDPVINVYTAMCLMLCASMDARCVGYERRHDECVCVDNQKFYVPRALNLED